MKFAAHFGICVLFATGSLSTWGQTSAANADHRQNAISLEQDARYAEAAGEWRAYLKTHPQSAEAYANLGIMEARQEHYKEAIQLYRKAYSLDPSMSGIQLNLGLAYFKSAAMQEAIDTFTPLLKTYPVDSPDYMRVQTLIGLAHYSRGEYAVAIPYLRKAANADTQNIMYRFSLAQSCLNAKQYQCVLDTYRELLRLNAESAAVDMLAGQAYDEMKNTAGAIDQFRAAVKADPKWPNAHFALGYLLWTQNQCDEASTQFQAELEIVPENAQAMTYLADCKIQLGQSNDALPLAERAVKIDPGIAKAHMDLGIIYQEKGQLDDALRELTTAVKLMPQDSNIHWRLARLYQAMGRKDEAKAEFEKTSSLHKQETDAIFNDLKAAQEKGQATDTNNAGPQSK